MSTELAAWVEAIGTWAGAIATFLAVVIALGTVLWSEYLRPRWRGPRLKIEFENQEPFCRVFYRDEADASGSRRISSFRVRIRIGNVGNETARRCVGKLMEVQDSNHRPVLDFDPVLLQWVSGDGPMDITPGDREFIEIIYVDEGTDHMHVAVAERTVTGTPIRFQARSNFPQGEYHLKIGIFGGNVEPAEERFLLTWHGEYTDVRI